MSLEQSQLHNRLLALLARQDFEVLAPHLRLVELPKGVQLAVPNVPIETYYFIETGLGSIVCSTEGFKSEVGMVGREGVIPTAVIMNTVASPHEIIMQVGGNGYGVQRSAFDEILQSNAKIRRLMLRFVSTLTTQGAYTALSNAVHHVEERLARWILMCHDRMNTDEMNLTHDYLAILLAVRRPSVTTALHILEGNRLIYSTRGIVRIRDREGLERFAADAYGAPEAEYQQLIGPMCASGWPAARRP